MKSLHRHIVLDVETTGLSPRYGHRVIEIGAVAIEDGKAVEEFEYLIDPGVRIPHDAQKIHGITNAMLAGKPKPEDVMPRLYEFINNSILVAHNALFDLRFLRFEFERLKLELPHRYVCTLEMSKLRFSHLANHRLETVYRHIVGENYQGKQIHRALADARMTAAIWLALEA